MYNVNVNVPYYISFYILTVLYGCEHSTELCNVFLKVIFV